MSQREASECKQSAEDNSCLSATCLVRSSLRPKQTEQDGRWRVAGLWHLLWPHFLAAESRGPDIRFFFNLLRVLLPFLLPSFSLLRQDLSSPGCPGTHYLRLTSNSQRSTCLWLSSACMKALFSPSLLTQEGHHFWGFTSSLMHWRSPVSLCKHLKAERTLGRQWGHKLSSYLCYKLITRLQEIN